MDNNELTELLNKATDLIEQKSFNEAYEVLQEANKNAPQNPEVLKNLGLVLVNLEDYVESKKVFDEIVKLTPDDANAWYYLGCSEEKLEDYPSAINSYRKVIELRPKYIDAYKAIGILYLKVGQYETLVELLEQALEYEKEDYQIYYIISSAYMAKKEDDKAVEYLLIANKLNPEHEQILNNLATCSIAVGKYDEAEGYLRTALAINPENAATNYNLGTLYQIREDFKGAYDFFNRAYIMEPILTHLSALAFCAIRAEKWDVAVNLYKSLTAIRPDKYNYRMNYLNCCIQTDKYKEGLQCAEFLAKLNPKSVDVQKKLAYLYRLTKQPAKTIEIIEKLLKRGKVDYEIYYNIAIANANIDELEVARDYLKKCLVLEPENPVARRDLGIIYLRMNYMDWAEDEFKTVLEQEPNNPENYFNYGLCLGKIQKFKEANACFEKAIEIFPGDIRFYIYGAENYLHQRETEKARAVLIKGLDVKSEHPKLKYLLAKIYFDEKKYKPSRELLEDSLSMNKNPEAMNLYGKVCMKLKDFETAADVFHKLHHEFPENHLLLCDLAACNLALDKKEEAKEAAKKALMIFPDFEDAIKILEEVQNDE